MQNLIDLLEIGTCAALQKANLSGARLTKANFTGANLSGAVGLKI